MQVIWDWFRTFYEATGINLTIFYDSFDRQRFGQGVLTTLWLSLVSVVLSTAIGLAGAWLQTSRFKLTNRLVQTYIALFRNTPPLIQLYFFFFVVGGLLRVSDGHGGTTQLIGSFGCAVISLSFYFGSFNVEIFRAGVESVPRTTLEGAEALGFSRFQTFALVIAPLAVRFSLPALANNLVGLVKGTSLAYAIAVPEVLYVSSQIWADELNVTEMMNVLLIFYFAVVGVVVIAAKLLERALRLPGYGFGR